MLYDELAAPAGALVFDVSNVVEYFFAQSDEEYWTADKFPCCIPPGPLVWMEATRPTKIVSKVHGVHPWQGADRWGALIERIDLPPLFAGRPKPWFFTDHQVEGPTTLEGALFEATEAHRWFVRATVVLDVNGETVPIGTVRTVLDHSGKIQAVLKGGTNERGEPDADPTTRHEYLWMPLSAPDIEMPEMPEETWRDLHKAMAAESRRSLEPFWLALSFLHCSNTVTVDGAHPRQQRRWAERNGTPLCTFKVLRIDPLDRRVSTRSSAPVESGHISLHIRRGGFRDYREGAGLFGKIHKLVWFDQMLVGSPDVGLATKTYQVDPPQEDA